MKKVLLIIISLFLFISVANCAEITVDAPSAILIDQNTGKVLYKKKGFYIFESSN